MSTEISKEKRTAISLMVRLQVMLIILFIFFKAIRPTVLKSSSPEWTKVTLLSLPNFFEGFIGILVLTGISLYINYRFIPQKNQVKKNIIYISVTVFSAIYVITQEFKIHNLGGRNVFDKNDVIFSCIGLIFGFLTIRWIHPIAK